MRSEKLQSLIGVFVRRGRAQFRATDTVVMIDIDWDGLLAPLYDLFPHCDAIASALDPQRRWYDDAHHALVRLEFVIQWEIDRLVWERKMHDAYLRDIAQKKAKTERQKLRRAAQRNAIATVEAALADSDA